ncbi:MAG: heme ABC transporter permease [Pseudomonadales bacterium]|nr:heme ABC transporter permease [Pseudomonadales bacterium]
MGAVLLLSVGTVWGLAFAPADYQQGNSFRIMYIHVPTAIVAQSSYMMMGVAGLILLVWRMKLADVVAAAIVPLGFSMTLIALFTGAIWGKPTWGTWWIWDARTTSMLVLLFLFIGVGALRDAISSVETAGRACAVLAVVGMINIPIIKYSVDWWLTLHQSSSISLTSAPTMPSSMWVPLLLNILGMYCFFGAVLTSAVRTGILIREQNTVWVAEVVAGEVDNDVF